MAKDTALSHGSIFDYSITKGTLESVKLAKQRYNHNLENNRKLKEAEAEKLQMLAKRRRRIKLKKKYNKNLKNFILKFSKSQMT